MKSSRKLTRLSCISISVLLAAVACPQSAEAALLFQFTEVGDDVLLEVSGELDVSGLSSTEDTPAGVGISPVNAVIGISSGSGDLYNFIDDPNNLVFGIGGLTVTSGASGTTPVWIDP